MTQHTDPPGYAAPPASQGQTSAPEPSFAEKARTLVNQAREGTLATLSHRHHGHPFASLMPYALDPEGRPLVLISSLAVHTHNLKADPRASLLVTEPDPHDEPLAVGRVTLLGTALRLPADETATARATYLARHPNSAHWVDFGDFGFWRLDLIEVYMVGGFGAMDWVSAAGYLEAAPDPLASVARSIIDHMNQDHRDGLLAIVRAGGQAEAEEASLVAVDRLGFRVRVRSGQGLAATRIAFPYEVSTVEECRAAFVAMLQAARR
jgi:putative heme iron utilization protein